MQTFIKILTVCVFFSSSTVLAHKQPVHQHITREAFKLLVKSHPQLANSEKATYVGTSETSNPYDRSWGAGKIVSGAWIEDEYDIVYHYGIGKKPTFNQWHANAYAKLFPNGERQAFTSITHFWNADGGLNPRTDVGDIAGGNYWLFCPENAMQKMYKYVNGDFDNRWLYPERTTSCAPFTYLGSVRRMVNFFEPYDQSSIIYAVSPRVYIDSAHARQRLRLMVKYGTTVGKSKENRKSVFAFLLSTAESKSGLSAAFSLDTYGLRDPTFLFSMHLIKRWTLWEDLALKGSLGLGDFIFDKTSPFVTLQPSLVSHIGISVEKLIGGSFALSAGIQQRNAIPYGFAIVTISATIGIGYYW